MLTNDEMKLAKQQYRMQRNSCKNRIDRLNNPIEMRLTFEEWLDIWLQSGHWHERGCRKDQYCMSRYNDLGHYEIGNIEIKSVKDNIIEKTNSTEWQAGYKLGRKKMKADSEWKENVKLGAQKTHSKSISCDSVIYPSQTSAATALAPNCIKYKIQWLKTQMKKFPERFFYTAK